MKILISILSTFILMAACRVQPQAQLTNIQLENSRWQTSAVVFTPENRAEMTWMKHEPSKDRPDFGTFIEFQATTFRAYYSAPCGNDCFTNVIGDYKLLKNNELEIVVRKIAHYGDSYCHYPEGEHLVEDKLLYTLTATEKGLLLKPVL